MYKKCAWNIFKWLKASKFKNFINWLFNFAFKFLTLSHKFFSIDRFCESTVTLSHLSLVTLSRLSKHTNASSYSFRLSYRESLHINSLPYRESLHINSLPYEKIVWRERKGKFTLPSGQYENFTLCL